MNEKRKLRFKVSILLQAMVEMSDNKDGAYERLAKYLRFDLLLYNIVDVYKGYEDFYGPELISEALN